MDKKELFIRIDSVFKKDIISYRNGTFPWSINSTNKEIIYECSDRLIQLFFNFQDDVQLRDYFKYELLKKITHAREYSTDYYNDLASNVVLCFFTMIKLGFIDEAIEALRERAIYLKTTGSLFIFLHLLASQNNTPFTFEQSHKVLNIIEALPVTPRYQSPKDDVIGFLTEENYEKVKNEIKGINIEINRDKEEIKNLIEYLDFDDKYNELLNSIDLFLNTEDKCVSSAMIGNLRSYMEDLLIDLAKRIASKLKEEIPQNSDSSTIGNARAYLKIKLELSDNDNKLINAYVNILHSEGGHSFVSNKHYFRLSRNIGIEIVLMILSKYKILFCL